MRIAQVAPLFESVPPKLYGGTERVVSYLTEALVRQGHDVTLFASDDSETSARLVAPCGEALRLAGRAPAHVAYHLVLLEHVLAEADGFDVVHFHLDTLPLPLARRMATPSVTTMHGRLDLPELVPLYRTYPEAAVVSISDAQRGPLPWLSWQATVHHGLPPALYTPREAPGRYLAFLGRICPEKGILPAIEIARRAGVPLKIAAKVDDVDRAYFEAEVRPHLGHPLVEYVGEVGDAEKDAFLGEALGVLFPIDWPEPFGMVMIEAFACGTPVVAFPCGSVPEIMRDGVSGYVVGSVEEAVAAVRRLDGFDRRRCRAYFEERFTDARMAADYVDVYERLLTPAGAPLAAPAGDGSAGLPLPSAARL